MLAGIKGDFRLAFSLFLKNLNLNKYCPPYIKIDTALRNAGMYSKSLCITRFVAAPLSLPKDSS
ncbi:hypothetical protein BCO_0900175 (plasmid) [Borrelia coriaceae ATCC 43381]|uniref:Uncharacterized protein n=1 Tax=Borrelia coriaceae ATCC 43381 TaxID=1408429 RepID=W5SYW1_9SPIR|nr:hypothetical protein BCO_0900175 [Borrelia coriaceae ATCC 43381]